MQPKGDVAAGLIGNGTPVFNPELYPRQYRLRWRWLVLLGLSGGVVAIVSALAGWHFAVGADALQRQYQLALSGLCLLVAALAVVAMVCMVDERVCLNRDTLEHRSLF